jgi:hypothetical protein
VAQEAQVVVKDVAVPGAVTLRVGQTLGIVAPSPERIYQVDFASDLLRMLTPAKSVA